MSSDQLTFSFGTAPAPESDRVDDMDGAVPHLRDEIARAWGLPLGQHVELALLRGPCDSLRGRLDLHRSPDLPWDSHQPLALSIAGVTFSSRDIDHWKRL